MIKISRTRIEKTKEFLSRKETRSVLLMALFLLLAFSSIFYNPQLYLRSVHEGDIALQDTYAPYDFEYSWGVDEEKTAIKRDSAFSGAPYYVFRDVSVEEAMRSDMDAFFVCLQQAGQVQPTLDEMISTVKEKTGIQIPDQDYEYLLEESELGEVKKGTLQMAKNILVVGYIDDEGIDMLRKAGAEKARIFDARSETQVERAPKNFVTRANIKESMEAYSQELFADDPRGRKTAESVAIAMLRPNLRVDIKKTEEEKKSAADKVQPVYNVWNVKKNEKIIEKGERVNSRHIVQLETMRSFLKEGRSRMLFAGMALLFALLGMIGAVYMSFARQTSILKETKVIAMILLNMLFMIIVTDFVMRLPQPSYFIPMASMSMMLVMLVGFREAFLSSVLMSILISVLTGGKIEVGIVLLAGSVAGMYAIRGARRRASILWAGLLAGAVKFVAIICTGLLNGIELGVFLQEGLWGIASGFLSGVIVMGLLPVFENVFKVPTNISLLEMSDLNHPLLKKMAMEAPGTYHHSIMVGNLAEAACASVGANSLLARVGAYYHDIGKISKPQYFNENEMGGKSRHTDLAPSMSALIIASHVKEGVEAARKYKLSNTIIDFVKQHHGDSLISYFYQKALEQAKEDDALKEESFRYPGPRPQTRESAIVLLADSVEASSRALDDPTPSSIRNLVTKVINSKFIDGQLDQCDLTLRDMHKIAEAFVRVLMGVFHTRAVYPEEDAAKSRTSPVLGERDEDREDDNGKPRKQKPKGKG